MKRREFLRMAGGVASASLTAYVARGKVPAPGRPNVLFITVDDMNCDSIGVFGCKVKDTSPNLDRLAGEGIRFTHAHVQVGNGVPSRNVMQTGRYPHSSGVEGFYKIQPDFPILPDLMKENGYFTGIKGKVSHSTPYHPYPWDFVMDQTQEKDAGKGNTKAFYRFTGDAIGASQKANKPFYVLVNITDPHTPFYGLAKGGKEKPDKNKPTRVFTPDEIVVPGFLPDTRVTRKELAHYYSSVRRADDCVGATLQALEDSGEADNTVVIFLSDHGMPFPFAKTNVYHHSTRTPWIARWPGKIKPGSVDRKHMISAIDFMPTVLDVAGIAHPAGLQGHSFMLLLLGQTQEGRDMVVKEYNENSGGHRHPMRSIETRKYGYIFNPWANGERRFRTATQGMQTYKEMQRLAESDEAIAARLRLFEYRSVEEFYDYENDPDALHNLIDNPEYRPEIDRLRRMLEQWMIQTKDPCLSAFRNSDDPAALDRFIEQQQQASDERRKQKRLSRKKKESEKKKDSVKKDPPSARFDKDAELAVATPSFMPRGQSVTITLNYTIPERHGEQPIHVTLKGDDNKRIERKVVKGRGAGSVEVALAVPVSPTLKSVRIATFIGEDYMTCLRHAITKPIPVK